MRDASSESDPAAEAAWSPPVEARSDRVAERLRDAGNAAAPRLGVGHLLLMTGFAGLYLEVLGALGLKRTDLIGGLATATQSLLVAACWTGLALLVLRGVRGARWAVEPGHWLLSAMGARLAVAAVLFVANRAFLRPFIQPEMPAFAAFFCVLAISTLARDTDPVWKTVLIATAALACLPILVSLGPWAAETRFLEEPLRNISLPALLVLPWLAVAWERRTDRSWLHWVGLALWTLLRLIENVRRFYG